MKKEKEKKWERKLKKRSEKDTKNAFKTKVVILHSDHVSGIIFFIDFLKISNFHLCLLIIFWAHVQIFIWSTWNYFDAPVFIYHILLIHIKQILEIFYKKNLSHRKFWLNNLTGYVKIGDYLTSIYHLSSTNQKLWNRWCLPFSF